MQRPKRLFKSVQDKIDRYSGNNPDKYQSELRSALRDVRELEQTLKANGALPRTQEEELFAELDAVSLMPDRSKLVSITVFDICGDSFHT